MRTCSKEMISQTHSWLGETLRGFGSGGAGWFFAARWVVFLGQGMDWVSMLWENSGMRLRGHEARCSRFSAWGYGCCRKKFLSKKAAEVPD